MKHRTYFVPEERLPVDVRSHIATEIACRNPGADAEQVIADIERMIAREIGSQEIRGSEAKSKEVSRHAKSMANHAFKLCELIDDAPAAFGDALNQKVLHARAALDDIEAQLWPLYLACQQVATEKRRSGAPHSRFIWIAAQIAASLRSVGIEPDKGEGGPYKAILAIVVQHLEPQRKDPDVSNYARDGLKQR